ncbi:MAG: bacteriohemerythrin [Rhizomicrobium sp.]|nr:bacteriohemerythrin [Rhizomicrobium sp.]
MPRMIWAEHYSVGVASIDAQHQKMMALLNRLHDGMMAGTDKIALGGTLQALIDYTMMHFKFEEELLARADYPDCAAHRQEHAALLRQIQAIRQQYEKVGPRAVTIPVLSFLANWIANHILGADMRYRSHVLDKGVA